MWRTNNKLKAFTLSELLIVLILTVVIVGVAFSILRLVSQQITAIQDVYENKSEILHLKQQLKYDLDNAKEMHYNSGDDSIVIYKEGETVHYEFSDRKFYRHNEIVPLEITDFTVYKNGKESSSGEVDAIEFEIEVKSNSIKVFTAMNNAAVLHIK